MSTTAPVTKDNFASANGDFYAQASGLNRHRRATPAELKTHFKTSGSDKGPPAHWYEAQLIHYGLPASKSKPVAFKRLFDAVNAGKLSVPAHITKVEAELKKEWTKRDREAKKEAKGQAVGAQKPTEKLNAAKKTAGAKRKAEDNVGLTISVGGISVSVAANSSTDIQGVAKKVKMTTTKAATTDKTPKTSKATSTIKAAPKATKTVATPKVKTPAKGQVSSAKPKAVPKATAAPKDTTISSQSVATAPRTKQTARCRRGGLSHGPSRSQTLSSPVQPSMPPQYARRGGSFASRGGGHLHSSSRGYDDGDDDEDDDAPPPYSEYNNNSYSSSSRSHNDQPLEKLGLLNGRYNIESPDVSEQWPHLGNDFGLVLTLDGSKLWGSFDLGVYEGILRFDVRPYESSHEPLDFTWRGRENEGEIIYGNSNTGWIKFLGGGRIEGYIDRMSIEFRGHRVLGQGTRSEVDAASMKSEWNEYSEDEYDRENRSRWGGSSW